MSNKIINHKFREILFPTLLIVMTINLTSMADLVFVANFIGHNGQAALQVFEPLVMLTTIFEWLFGLGGQILSLNKKAEFDDVGSNHYFTVALLTTLVLSIMILLICFIFKDSVIAILNPTSEIVPYVNDYATFAFISFPIATLLAVLTEFVRVDNLPKLASALIIIANVVNIIFDVIFLGYFHTGIEGASIATVIGYTVGLICALKYYHDSKITFRFILSKLQIRSWIKSTIEIIKIGSPGASIALFVIITVYVMNFILSSILGTIGLNIFNVCLNALLVISIFVIGISMTLSSVVSFCYAQNDFYNLKYIIRKSIILAVLCSVVFTIILWVDPDKFLIFFNLNQTPYDAIIKTAIRLFSLAFIPYAFVGILIFYYEGIERFIPSGIVSIVSIFIGPLLFTLILYPQVGINGIWLSFLLGMILAIISALIYSKIIERREKEYYGLFFIKKDLIPKTRNYAFENFNDQSKYEMYSHLKDLNIDNSNLDKLENVLKYIFESNGGNIPIEIYIIDFDDCIKVNIKDEGKMEIFKDNPDFSNDEQITYSEVLGFNNVMFTVLKGQL